MKKKRIFMPGYYTGKWTTDDLSHLKKALSAGDLDVAAKFNQSVSPNRKRSDKGISCHLAKLQKENGLKGYDKDYIEQVRLHLHRSGKVQQEKYNNSLRGVSNVADAVYVKMPEFDFDFVNPLFKTHKSDPVLVEVGDVVVLTCDDTKRYTVVGKSGDPVSGYMIEATNGDTTLYYAGECFDLVNSK